jgi:hypothetical protein
MVGIRDSASWQALDGSRTGHARQKDGGAAVPYLVQHDGEKLVAEAATVSEAIQAGEKAELEGRNAVRIITPSGQSFSVSEYKVIVAGVRVESE